MSFSLKLSSSLGLCLLLGSALGACAESGGDGADKFGPSSADQSSGTGGLSSNGSIDGSVSTPNMNGSGGSLASLPEEVEDESSFNAPVATGSYLWSANPQSGRVALIDVADLTVQVLAAGLAPTHLASVPSPEGVSEALVLNVGSSDATRFVVSEGQVSQSSVSTHVGANRWSVSQSGVWAVAWSAAERGKSLDPTEGLQEITIVRVDEVDMVATRLTVGYRPNQVIVSEDDSRLIVVSEEGITLLDLTGTPTQDRWIDLGSEAEIRDVSVSEDGNFALVRRSGESTVDVIDLTEPDKVITLNFSGPVTDVDLSKTGRAVAIVREHYELSTFLLEDVWKNPNDIDTLVIEGEIFGSSALTEDGNTVVLYTNATDSERISIVDLSSANFLSARSLSIGSPIYSVATTPDGEHASVLAGDGTGQPSSAFSLLALRSERFPRVVGTGAPVDAVALGNEFGIVTATSSSTGVYEAHLVEFPGLSHSTVKLSARPLSVGVLTDLSSAYAAQVHPEGRVTFFDFAADQTRTLTGFELSAEVVDE